MTGILAVVALACAAAACAAVIRTQIAVHRLAKALAREWGLRVAGASSALPSNEERLAEREEWLKRSVEALEQRLREVLARATDVEARVRPAAPVPLAPAGPSAPTSPPDRVREHLLALGCEDVAILPPRATGGAFVFEARREGMPAKGSARLTPDGRVELRWGEPLRAFP
jgi:hypothetical protein